MSGPLPTGQRAGQRTGEPTAGELLAAVRALTDRVEQLETELATLRAVTPAAPPSEDVLVAISAAVAAFLGHRAKVKQVHYRTGAAYAQQGRAVVQGRHNTHGSR